METLWQDIRYALRQLRKNPGFTAVAVLTLALGIGANTAIFSVVNTALLAHPPYKDADRLAMIWSTIPSRGPGEFSVSAGDYFEWKQKTTVFEDMAASFDDEVTLTGAGNPQFILGYRFSANYFEILGVKPALGRTFTAEEDRPGAPQVVVLSDKLWRTTFHADPQILGKSITLDDNPHTVIGVMPPEFQYPPSVELWMPMAQPASVAGDFQHRYIHPIGRLKAGVSATQAQAAMNKLECQIAAEQPATDAGNGVSVKSLRHMLAGDIRLPLLILLGAVGFVFFIACANVASLLLARATTRQREVAIRVALGAGRARLLLQFLTESLLLSVAGGALGVLLGAWCTRFLVAIFPNDIQNLSIPKIEAIPMEGRVLSFGLGITILSVVIFGVLPAMFSARPDGDEVLRESGRSATPSSHSARLRRVLVVAEIALSLVLLAGAGLLLKSFDHITSSNLGFRPDKVLAVEVFLPNSRYPGNQPEKLRAFVDGVVNRLEALAGVQSAAAVNFLPLTGFRSGMAFLVEGQAPPRPGEQPSANNLIVTPGYFQTMGIPLLRGRAFVPADHAGTEQVAIVNSTLAQRYFGGEDPVGKILNAGSPEHPDRWRIVGVVGDVRAFGLDQPVSPELYRPFDQTSFPLIAFTIRTGGDPAALAKPAEQAVWDVDKGQPVFKMVRMSVLSAQSVALRRVSTTLLVGFATLALVLATIGVYGVMTFAVAQRTHEVGIRMALGAQQRDVLWLVLGQGTEIVAAGVAIGAIAALALAQSMHSLLYGVSATDPVTFASVVLLLFGVAMLACYIPARRAMRVDPMVALRHE